MATISRQPPYDDFGRKIVDENLKDLEARLSAMYKQAGDEIQRDLDQFMRRFEERDLRKQAQLVRGEITPQAYVDWKERQLFRSNVMQAKIDDLSQRMVNVDKEAMAMVNKELPDIYTTSYNWGGFRGETYAEAAGYDYHQFSIYNKDAVRILATEDPDLIPWKPMPDEDKDKQWNRKHIQGAVQQGILQGDSMDKIAKRLQSVINMNNNAAIRTARTAVTSVENKGRKDATERVKEGGIPMTEVWECTHDGRTRDTHILLDGTKPNEEGYFGEGILDRSHLMQYPADPNGEPQEVYNCRCRLNTFIDGIDHSQDRELYEKFMSENYEEDWEKIKAKDGGKEEAFQEKKAGAKERVEKRRQNAGGEQKDSSSGKKEYKMATNKQEAEQLLKDLGFRDISADIHKMDEQLLCDNVNQLASLNEKYGAIPQENFDFVIKKMGANSSVTMNGEDGYLTSLNLNSDKYLDSPMILANSKRLDKMFGYSMPFDDDKASVYTITHEYGHIVEDRHILTDDYRKGLADLKKNFSGSAYDKAWSEYDSKYRLGRQDEIRKEILDIAKEINPRFKIGNNISKYGKSNSAEFFAESFANSQLGEPNDLGRAMSEWLRRHGYDS